MKRGREDEQESEAVVGSGDAPAVVAAVAGESSSGAPAARRRAVTVADSTVPVVVAVDDGEKEDAVAPAADPQNEHAGRVIVVPDDEYYDGDDPDSIEYMIEQDRKESVPFKEEASDDGTEEDSDDVGHDKDDRDRKSRFVLQRLMKGITRFRDRNGDPYCPFCGKAVTRNLESLIQHANSVGRGSQRKHQGHTMAKHAAYGRFLDKYVKGGLIPVIGPAVGPHVLFPED